MPKGPTVMQQKRLLGDAIALAKRVESAWIVRPSNSYLPGLMCSFLTRAKKDSAVIHSLPTDSIPEAQPNLRALMELAINLRWILIRDSRRRANRFARYMAVDRVKLFDQVPKSMRTPRFDGAMAEARLARWHERHLFRYRDRKGRMRWAQSWAGGGGGKTFTARLHDVLEAMGKLEGDKSAHFFEYSYYSARTHGNSFSLGSYLEGNHQRGIRAALPQRGMIAPTLAFTTLFLLDIMQLVNRELGMSYGDEIMILVGRWNRLGRS